MEPTNVSVQEILAILGEHVVQLSIERTRVNRAMLLIKQYEDQIKSLQTTDEKA